jgi:hypothetical protein
LAVSVASGPCLVVCPFACSAVFGVVAISLRVPVVGFASLSQEYPRGCARHTYNRRPHGAIAQLGERGVCNAEVAGSNPAGSISLN